MQIGTSNWERLMSGDTHHGRQTKNDQAGAPGLSGTKLSARASSGLAAGAASGVTTEKFDAVEWGMSLLRNKLEARFESRAPGDKAKTDAVGGLADFKPPSSEDVAKNVLGFIEGRLKQEQASGASPERMGELLAQARKGVEQGFSEARDIIKGVGRMNDSLSGEIDDSFSRIQDGLKDLDRRLVKGETTPAPVTDKTGTTATGAKPATTAARMSGYNAVEYASREKLSLEVMTKEGDRVRIRIDERQYAGAIESYEATEQGASLTQVSGSMSYGRYQLEVEGDLSDAELESLGKLFGEVDSLAGKFFGGDVQGAFDQALDMGIDGSTLSSYSVQMSYSRVASATRYTEMAEDTAAPAARLKPLGDVAKGVGSALAKAREVGMHSDGLHQLLDRMLEDQSSARQDFWKEPLQKLSRDFLDGLFARLKPEDAKPEGVNLENTRLEGIKPEGIKPEGINQEAIKPEDAKPAAAV